jgi:hypothetical protein
MRAALLTPLYISASWVLTVSYQLFTDTAVRTVAANVAMLSPAAATWISANIETIVFVYAFTWIFVLSSVIPTILLGKGKGVLVQYVVCLVIAFLALSVQSLLIAHGGAQIQQLFSSETFLNNPILAGLYLMIPYTVMIAIDAHARRKRKEQETYYVQELQPLIEKQTA